MNKWPRTILAAALGISILGCGGCTKKWKEASHRRKADAFFADNKYESAEIEYINVLRIDQKDSQALGRLGSIYVNEGRPRSAFSLLAGAILVNPDNLEARKKIAQLHAQFGKFPEAKQAIDYVLDHQPTDPEAPLLLVDISRTRAALEEARSRLEAFPASATQGAPVLVALGMIDLHEHKFDSAAASFGRAHTVDPKFADAESAFAYLYWAENDRSKAESAFAEAASMAPPYSPKQLQYAEFEARVGKLDAAKQLLDTITTNAPSYLGAWLMLAQIASDQKRYDDGLKYVGKVLAIDAQNPQALLQKSRLELAKGDATDAVSGLESASRDYPKSAQVDFELAKAYMAAGNTDKAELSLKRVLAISPNVLDAQIMLATIEVKKGDVGSAIAVLKKVIKEHPESIQAQLLLGEALRANGQIDEAISQFQQISEHNPKDTKPVLVLGSIYLQQHETEKARAAFEKALSIDPNYLPALEHLVDLDLYTKNYAQAHRRIEDQIEAHPTDGQSQLILARIYLLERNAAGAETALKRSIELQPDGTRAYALLAGLYLNTNRDREALADVQAAVAKHPDNTDAMMLMGAIQDREKDYAGERATYEKVLSINPNYVTALNNLAYLYTDRLNDLDKALESAEKAERLQSDEPHVGDTLGWILYQQHKYTRALPLETESAGKLPSEGDVQYHAGMVAYMLGREDAAREYLQRALTLNPQFEGRDEAVRRLSILKSEPGKGGTAARESLERQISIQKEDPVALDRLAALYEADGAVDKAVATCEEALKVSPDDATVMVRLAGLYVSRNDFAKAIEYGKKARLLAPDDPQLAHVLGKAAYQTRDYPWSLSLLQEAAPRLPDDPEVHFDLGKSYFSEGNVPDAEAQMKAALQAGPSFPRGGEAKQVIQMLDLSSQSSWSAADRSTIQQSLDAHPDDTVSLFASAVAHQETGDAGAAKKEFEKLLASLPDFTPAKRGLAILYSKSGEDDKTGLELAVKARAAFPDDATLAQALGTLDYRRGDFLSAKNFLVDASAQRGDDPELNFYLGMSELNLKDLQAAKRSLQKALDSKLGAPHSAEARQALEKIK